MTTESGKSLVEDLANAPGTLPAPQVEERFRAQEWQFRHDNTIDPLAPRPEDPVAVWATTGSGMRLDRATVFYTTDGSVPDVHSAAAPMDIARVDWDVRTGYLSRWRAELPPQPAGTRVRYRIGGCRAGVEHREDALPDVWAHDGQGFWFRDQGESGISVFAYESRTERQPLPAWMDGVTIYHIFLDRFDSDETADERSVASGARQLHGGTLAGVRRHLEYLRELGVGCLWLSPLHPSETYHRYDTMDFFGVDPRLGTIDDLRALVTDAHAAGMRIILDFVPSHLSWRHPAFLEAQNDASAPTHDWFTWYEWPNRYRSFLDLSRYLPSLNTNDPGARAHLIDSALYWVRDIGVDGFRLDHAIGPGMDFWVAFRSALEEADPDVVTIGEATDTPDSLKRYRGKIHGILDFELAASLRLSLGRRGWNVTQLENAISAYERFMADGPGRVSFLDNHDMDRFLWIAGNDVTLLKMAALCQFSLSPTPTVYYGTEIGMSQELGAHDTGSAGDAEARRDMVWNRDEWNAGLLEFYRALIRARRAYPALTHGQRQVVALDEHRGVWAYVRSLREGESGQSVVTAFNLGSEPAQVDLPANWKAADLLPLAVVGTATPHPGGVTLGGRSGGMFALT